MNSNTKKFIDSIILEEGLEKDIFKNIKGERKVEAIEYGISRNFKPPLEKVKMFFNNGESNEYIKEEINKYSRDEIKFMYFIERELKKLYDEVESHDNELEVREERYVLWKDIAKIQVPRAFKMLKNKYSIIKANKKKIATICCREYKRAITKTSKTNPILKGKKITKELSMYHKKTIRKQKLEKRKSEKQEQDKRKKEMEDKETQRQSRKLNYLINQTELFTHFILNKNELKNQTNNVKFDIENAENDNEAAKSSAIRAVKAQIENKKEFLSSQNDSKELLESDKTNIKIEQPEMLKCTLKEYQVKGLAWLINLYNQGINGILADDMGLGKTVQTIAFLAHLAEVENIWGPFIIVTPASTLHNWIQEFQRFLPNFNVLSYWGSINERKKVRKNWKLSEIASKNSPSHVVLTSYQIAVADEKILQKIKWQYMILDEAQAIKSSQSLRWKILLSIKCRNRLLLTGTPIQNSMQELWALLHFIMPTLFDSQDEFNDWFSKDIENSTSSKKQVNEKQLQRLHLILKPFMLRREKTDVKDELGLKTEKAIYCELSHRQKMLYKAIKDKTPIAQLLEKKNISEIEENEGLMNLCMQFRKVCNHPDLFEKLEVESSYSLSNNYVPNNKFFITNLLDQNLKIKKFRIPKVTTNLFMINRNTDKNIIRNIKSCEFINNNPYCNSYNTHTNDFHNTSNNLYSFHNNSTIVFDSDDKNILFSKVRNYNFDEKINSKKVEILCKKEIDLESFKKFYHFEFKNIKVNENKFKENVNNHKRLKRNDNRVINIVDWDQNIDKVDRNNIKNQNNKYTSSDVDLKSKIILGIINKINFRRNRIKRFYTEKINILPAIFEYSKSKYLENILQNIKFCSIPRLDRFVSDSGKLVILDAMLPNLQKKGKRILMYFQMTKMIDLIEEYLIKKGYSYLRLDGSSKISARRDMVNDWQTNNKFIFLLSTRAGGLGINLTAADTVIFYDSDWNPTVDQQAMDRAHRLGQTKDVTVYRLITKNTIEEKIMERAQRKGEIQKLVIESGEFTGSHIL